MKFEHIIHKTARILHGKGVDTKNPDSSMLLDTLEEVADLKTLIYREIELIKFWKKEGIIK